jgi:hypothetical protein
VARDAQIVADVLGGMTYVEAGEKYGIGRARVAQIVRKYRRSTESGGREIGIPHGTPRGWRLGCRQACCRAAHNEDSKTSRRAAADEAFPPEARAQLLRRLTQGATIADALPEGITAGMMWGRARRDPEWAQALDAALFKGRDPHLKHGTEMAYKRGCRCPECRAGRSR